MTNLLVIDDNKKLVDMIEEYFNDNNLINVNLKAYSGEEGIKLIENNKDEYDVIILDLIMPNKDGIFVLNEMKKKNILKPVIISTSYNSDEMIRRVSEYGVNKESKNINIYNNNLQISVTKILHELGVPSHIKGYQYIREGIMLLYDKI